MAHRRPEYGGRDPSGFFASLPLDWAMTPRDGLPVLLVTELNGEPLPHIRGGPVRLLVPDALGWKSISPVATQAMETIGNWSRSHSRRMSNRSSTVMSSGSAKISTVSKPMAVLTRGA